MSFNQTALQACFFFIFLAFSASWTGAAPSGSISTTPNFVVIFIDDLGYGDIQPAPFGSTINETPNLNRMAAEGMVLSSFYVGAPVCTPSRAALMTGCYPIRVGLAKGSGHAVLFPGDTHALNPDEVTIAEMLKAAGYATGCYGKWHLGDADGFLPTDQGFDEYFGIPYSNDMWPGHSSWPFPGLPIMRDKEVVDEVKTMEDQATLCRRFTEAAVDFIRSNKDTPFFVYLPHAFVHNPRAASPDFMAKAKDATEGEIEEVDWSVGQILQTLRDEGLAENTLVIFTSDNGAAPGCSSGVLRGRKGDAWEGGVREPTLAWWPGRIPAGSTSDEIMTAMDLLPTFAKLSGAAVPQDHVIDGKDITDLLLGKEGATTPHDRVYYHKGTTLHAVRSGPWKCFRNGELYNLEEDLSETTDVSAAHPEIVARLTGYIQEFEAEIAAHARPVGIVTNPRTLLPRPGVEGEAAYTPTLFLQSSKKVPKKKAAAQD